MGRRLTKKLGEKLQLVGDDNFVTNTTLLQKGIDLGVAQLDSHQVESDRHTE